MSQFEAQCLALAEQAKTATITLDDRDVLALLDHTCLRHEGTIESLTADFDKLAGVAGICVYANAASFVKSMFPSTRVIAVANFPEGSQTPHTIDKTLQQCVDAEVDEVDIVFPYQAYLRNRPNEALSVVQRAKQKLGDEVTLKVILETAEFPSLMSIRDATLDCLAAGANFIKTSTGTKGGASLPATAAILLTIQSLTHCQAGCKISGGINDKAQLPPYFGLVGLVFGQSWCEPNHFRVGASKLLGSLQS